jgi:PAS domain S-box-containing protein
LPPPETLTPHDHAHERELIDAAIAVNEAATLDDAFQALAEAGVALLGCERLAIIFWDDNDGAGIVRADTGDALGEVIQGRDPELIRDDALSAGEIRFDMLSSAFAASLAPTPFVVRVRLATEGGTATFHAFWAAPLDEVEAADAADLLSTLSRLTSLNERSAREREQIRLGSVLEAVADGVIVSADGALTANDAARTILGIPDGGRFNSFSFNLRTLEGILITSPSDIPDLGRFRVRATALDGRELVLDGSYAPLSGGTVIVFRDVTAEHARSVLNESYLYALFNSLPIPLLVGDGQSIRVVSANQAFLDLVGFEAEEIADATPPFPWWADDQDTDTGFDHGSRVRRTYRRKDGRTIPVEVLSHGINGDDGELALLLGVVTDLSEKQRLDRRLVQSGKLAAIGDLAAGVAHEINNPLFAILALTEFLLKDAEPGSKTQERLALIQETGLEIKEIVQGLLDFARENAEERHVVPLDDVIRSTVDLVRRTNAHKGVEFVDTYGDNGALVTGSSNQLKQVFLNLVANARQAMPNGGRVTIDVHRDGNDHVVATVTDEGPGIEPDVLGRMFEPFFTTKRAAGGTGLGLSIALGIAESHGGTLTAASEPGRGASFTLRLPTVEEDA